MTCWTEYTTIQDLLKEEYPEDAPFTQIEYIALKIGRSVEYTLYIIKGE